MLTLLFFVVGFLSTVELIAQAWDDHLVAVSYTHNPDELGRTVMLECCANRLGTNRGEVPDYTWERPSTDPPVSSSAAGVNSHTLFIANFSATDIGLYRCKISGFTTEYSAFIGVGSTGLLSAPGSITYTQSDNSTHRLNCIENSGAPFTTFNYKFYRHHAPMPSQAYANQSSLFIPGFESDDVGIYSCVVYNSEGISYGPPYELFFTAQSSPPPDPVITLHTVADDLRTGTVMMLTCCSAGVPPPQYAWSKMNMTTSEPQLLTNALGVYSSTLYVPITGATDSGVYRCTVFNSNGTAYAETNVDLVPEGPPFFINFSQSPISIAQGQQKFISCVAAGDPPPDITWSMLNGTLPASTYHDFTGLYVMAAEGINVSGVYVCTAANVNGTVEKYFEVQYVAGYTTASPTASPTDMLDPPVNVTVTGQSAVVEGTDLILNCSAVGSNHQEPTTFQWLRTGGSFLSKVTNTSSAQVVVPRVTWSDVGVYYCLAVNAGGATYSPAIYVLLQAEQGAIISNRKDPNKGLNMDLLRKAFGIVIIVVATLSALATAFVYFLARYREHVANKTATMWINVKCPRKGKNMFDALIRVEPLPEWRLRLPYILSLSSSVIRDLNIIFETERAFDDHESVGSSSSGDVEEEGLLGAGSQEGDGGDCSGPQGRKSMGGPAGPTSVEAEVVIEEEDSL